MWAMLLPFLAPVIEALMAFFLSLIPGAVA